MGPPGHTELGCHHLPPREHLLFSQKGSEQHFVAGDTEAQRQAVTPSALPQVPSWVRGSTETRTQASLALPLPLPTQSCRDEGAAVSGGG